MLGILAFQTDFTYKEGAVGAMYGVVKSVDPTLEIIDLTHEIPQYDTWSASYRLHQVVRFWPKGTVFVSVVDPGVGTDRRASVAKTTDGYYIVTPDNGTLTHLVLEGTIEEIREIDPVRNRLKDKGTDEVSIFHGRDLFSYCAAKLASGKITYEEVGTAYPVEEIVRHSTIEAQVSNQRVEGIFEISDPNFGNLWTNIKTEEFKASGFSYGDLVHTKIYHADQLILEKDIYFQDSFGKVSQNQLVIYNNELSKIALALNQENFQETYHLGYGVDWKIVFEKDEGVL